MPVLCWQKAVPAAAAASLAWWSILNLKAKGMEKVRFQVNRSLNFNLKIIKNSCF
jgi:hypothetical protein